jgi:hypothetical protein
MVLSVTPPPLIVVALEAAVRNFRILKKSIPYLPASLKSCLEQRRKKFIFDRDHNSDSEQLGVADDDT